MENRNGIVMEIKKRTAYIMTADGEFVEVKINENRPSIGHLYTGELVYSVPYYKYAAAVASIMFIILVGGGAFAYNKPVASTIININPSIKLETNFLDRIINITPLNNDGNTLIKNLKLKNKSINDGLNLIVDEAEEENYINESYKIGNNAPKQISIYFESTNNNKVNITKFKNSLNKKNLKYEIISETKNIYNKTNIKTEGKKYTNSPKTKKNIKYERKNINKYKKSTQPIGKNNNSIVKEKNKAAKVTDFSDKINVKVKGTITNVTKKSIKTKHDDKEKSKNRIVKDVKKHFETLRKNSFKKNN